MVVCYEIFIVLIGFPVRRLSIRYLIFVQMQLNQMHLSFSIVYRDQSILEKICMRK